MNLHEFQAKQLFARYNIPVPEARVAESVEAARSAARELGGAQWMVKAQVHAGGRGKAGGVVKAGSAEELEAAADRLLGSRLVTGQSAPEGQPINQVLIESPSDIAAEYYLGMLVDRALSRVVFMASAAGGMNIEEVARETPEKILTVPVHPAAGLQGYQCRQLAFGLGLEKQLKSLTAIMQGLYRLFMDNDLSLVEINPLVLTADGELLAVDAKINLDDSALYRHPELQALRDASQEDERENRAHQHGLNYVSLDGNIGCMVNGAGLAMATMDLIQLHGGAPANFLDVGGGTTAEKVAEAFKLILSDSKVKAILVNIFGGIVRCDLIAEGIIQAVKETGLELPVVVRLEGTNVDQGKALLQQSGLDIIAADGLSDAATRVVEAAGGQA
ncbi:MAG: ADP-forming succinate--CoA ligase subunit beta [Thiohalophilus sp.]|uniref:ADP-forming succinate--CoA ligase subunit beta n=1 Tax=Thiohalophilus sp. TaxID=3028392 RepID=UPI0028700D6D|nr:ADP-forming succinate--CoA ligase subunit beta [Thiohalophilus sp.]MDR9437653.1 ADP-forming succinate--CoA ligase subunit beta [Thiohalophilus sp.]